MNYALIENKIVINIIYLHPMNASDFQNAVPIENLPVQIGDTYIDGKFYRNGEEIKNQQPNSSYESGYDQALLDLMGGASENE